MISRSPDPSRSGHFQSSERADLASDSLMHSASDSLMHSASDSLMHRVSELAQRILRSAHEGRILLVPPDHTRKHSGAGQITTHLYDLLTCEGASVDIMPALGSHAPMSVEQLRDMFGNDIPLDAFTVHRWKEDTVRLGVATAGHVRSWSLGAVEFPVEIAVNRRLIEGVYDHIISIGQVVPHEVTGMSNYTKNIMIGCGGKDLIDGSHFMSAVYGIERVIGEIDTPARRLLDWAAGRFLESVPVTYLLTVNSLTVRAGGLAPIIGLFCGETREAFEEAARLSRVQNVVRLREPLRKAVVYLDGDEYRTTWLACKAIYRTRKAIADGGQLVVIAPGLERFGEDDERDRLIRAYGYCGRAEVLVHLGRGTDLCENLSVAAHLIHGSTDGRFDVTVACQQLSREEIEAIGFSYLPLDEAFARYDPKALKPGYNTTPSGEEVYSISNPALGLWRV